MTVAALVGVSVALVLVVLIDAGIVRSLIRQHARHTDLLLDKMMHLAGKTWTPPPSAEPPAVEDELETLLDTAALPYLSE